MNKPEASAPHPGKGLLDLMKAAGVAPTPSNFMNLNYLGKPPKNISAEERHELPPHMQPYVD